MKKDKLISGIQLKKEEESMTALIWSIVPAAERDALLVVDIENSCLKRVNLSSLKIDVLYRSSETYSLRGAEFVADSNNRMRSLLLVEMQSTPADLTMTYALVVPELDGSKWKLARRFDSDPSFLYYDSLVSICALRNIKVLCGVWNSDSLDVLSVPSALKARKETPIPLGFTLHCFTCGVSDSVELMFASDLSGKVNILEVCVGAPLALQLLRSIDPRGGKLLWREPSLLFCADRNAQSNTDEVRVWRISLGGRRAERLECTPITHADNLYIKCWCSLGDRTAIYDWKTKNLILYSHHFHT